MADSAEPTLSPVDKANGWNIEDLNINKGNSEPNQGLHIPTRAELDEIEESEDVKEVVTEPEVIEAPVVKQPTTPDPGEYIPTDYSFEVITYDDEGNKPKTHKISTVEQWDKLLEEEPNFGNASALMKADRLAAKMENNTERDYKDWEGKKQKFEDDSRAAQAKTEATDNMVNEINYLVSKNFLPKIADEYKNSDWSDKEIAKQPGVKEQAELLMYMRDENARRTKAGLKPMTSVLDAFNAMQVDVSRKQSKQAEKDADTARKVASGRVAGTTAAPASVAPKGIAVGRPGILSDW